MPTTSLCPQVQDLQQYVLGHVSEGQAERLEEHLKCCETCLGTMHTLHGDDTLVEAFRGQGRGPQRPAADETMVGLMERLRGLQLPAATATAAADGIAPEQYDFLAPPQAADELGRLGGYRVLRVLGAGGMGVVFQAEDPHLRRLVALKVMKPALAASASARRRFLREAQVTAALCHDHIVTIHQVGEDRGLPFLAMQFLHGETLADRLARAGRLPPAEVLRIGQETAEGLAAAHGRGLIHRDVKPANIWLEALPDEPGGLSPRYRVKIMDFGLARLTDDGVYLTQPGAIVGTPAYMAPEQAGGAAVDARCDLFGLGCVLYHLCTGRPPFTGSDTLATLMSVAAGQPTPPRELCPEVPAALSDLVMRLLAKDPAGRPASARAVVEAIEAMEAELARSRTGHPASPTPRPRPSAYRRGAVLVAAGLLLVAGGGLVAHQIIIRITDKQGNVKEIPVGPDEKVEIVSKQPGDTAKAPPAGSGQVHIRPEPLDLPAGAPLSPAALVAKPAAIKGVRSWTLETRGHRGEVLTLAFRGDGRMLATAGEDGTIRFWEADTGRLVRALVGHGSAVPAVAWSPDRKSLASASQDGTVRLWDAESGRPLRVLAEHGGPVTGVAWSPDGKTLATCGQAATPRLWDVESGKLLEALHGHTGSVSAVAWSPDGKTLASAGVNDKTVRLWEAGSGRILRVLPVDQATNQFLAFSPDGRILATNGVGTLRLWQTDAGQLLLTRSCPGAPNVAWSPDGKTLAMGNDTNFSLDLWDLEGGRADRRLTLPPSVDPESLSNVAWSADGKTVALGDKRGGLHFWEVDSGEFRQTIPGHAGPVGDAAGPPDGKSQPGVKQVRLRADLHLVISPDGHYRGTPRVERELVYVVQTDRGQETLTPDEFARKFGWQNDPERVPATDK